MACIVSLFDVLGGTPDTGGNWFFHSGDTFEFSYGTCPAAATVFTGGASPGDPIGTGHDICVDLSGTTGTYVFAYVVPPESAWEDCGTGCVECAYVTIDVVAPPEDGDPLEICVGGPVQTLYDLLGNTPSTDGNWSCDPDVWVNGKSEDDNGANDTFDPSDFSPGVYTFTYTVNSGVSCSNCVAEVVVTITAGPDGGDNSSATICV